MGWMNEQKDQRRRFQAAPDGGAADRRLASQLSALRNIFDHAVHEVLAGEHALDRVLSGFWRDHRCYGSRDRRLFSESLFAFFRFYGWLRTLLNDDERAAVERGDAGGLSGRTAAMLLLGAWTLENLPPEPAHALLARHFRLAPVPPPNPLVNSDVEERRRRWRQTVSEWLGAPAPLPEWRTLLPEWCWPRLPAACDPETYFPSLAVRPPLWLRIQTAACDEVVAELQAAGLTVKRHLRLPRAVAVTAGSVNLYTLEAYRAGRIEVQDLASQTIAAVCAPQRGERWWDACAGAGGKTLALAELMERTGKVVAGDIRAYKLEDLRQRARRAGFPNIEPRPWDGKKVSPRRGANFDGVLVDAPCSCAGVWRRNPDGRWNTTAADIDGMAAIQRTVLENVLGALRPGGVLIYATCSIFESENSGVVRDFLGAHPEFELEEFINPLNGGLEPGMLSVPGAAENCDSMFVARLRLRK